MNSRVYIYVLLMIIITNSLRILPVTIIRKKITNTFFRSFLYYVPFVTLAVMTVPAIMDATSSPVFGFMALVAGVIAAWYKCNLFVVSSICCAVVLILELLF